MQTICKDSWCEGLCKVCNPKCTHSFFHLSSYMYEYKKYTDPVPNEIPTRPHSPLLMQWKWVQCSLVHWEAARKWKFGIEIASCMWDCMRYLMKFMEAVKAMELRFWPWLRLWLYLWSAADINPWILIVQDSSTKHHFIDQHSQDGDRLWTIWDM